MPTRRKPCSLSRGQRPRPTSRTSEVYSRQTRKGLRDSTSARGTDAPPADPVNSLLSFLYAILTKDVTVTLQSVGFDPMLGFFHRPRYGRPSLALDLMEEFRPLIADSTVLSMINNREVGESDFVQRGGAVALTGEGRKRVLAAYERRMATEVKHPIFRYTVSYRRLLEVQARLLSRHVMGEIPVYPAFCTR